MPWWDVISQEINKGNVLYTPGRGLQGARRRPFTIVGCEPDGIIIASGRSEIPIEKKCFDTIENAFAVNLLLWLRVASLHDNEPFENSVDKLVREATGSQLARGNYICSILQHCGLVSYTMRGNKKGISLSDNQ
jgi:hypothetical protein